MTDRAELRELIAKATKGLVNDASGETVARLLEEGAKAVLRHPLGGETPLKEKPKFKEDGELIAKAVRSLPALLDAMDEAEREIGRLREFAHEATKTLTGLTPGGSEYFNGRIGEIYIADLKLCERVIRERFERSFEAMRNIVREQKAPTPPGKAGPR